MTKKPSKPAYFGFGEGNSRALKREGRLMEEAQKKRDKAFPGEFGMHRHGKTGKPLPTRKESNIIKSVRKTRAK